jgi:hypothetical protein
MRQCASYETQNERVSRATHALVELAKAGAVTQCCGFGMFESYSEETDEKQWNIDAWQ